MNWYSHVSWTLILSTVSCVAGLYVVLIGLWLLL